MADGGTNSKMRMCILVSSLDKGGAERMMGQLSRALTELGFEVHIVLTTTRDTQYEYAGTLKQIELSPGTIPSSLNIPQRIQNFYKRLKLIKQAVNSSDSDVVIVTGQTLTLYAAFLFRNCVFYVQNTLSSKITFSLPKRILWQVALKKMKGIVACSHGVKKDLHENISKKLSIDVIQNSISVEYVMNRANDEAANLATTFREWSENDIPIILNIGRLSAQKGQIHLLRIFANLLHDQQSYLAIIGNGEKEDEIKKAINELNLNDSVLLLPFQDNPHIYMKHSSVFAMTSLWEGLPVTMLEAAATGLPIVSTDCESGPREILSEYVDESASVETLTEAEYGLISTPISEHVAKIHAPLSDSELNFKKGLSMLVADEKLRQYYSQKSFERSKMFDVSRWYSEWGRYMEKMTN